MTVQYGRRNPSGQASSVSKSRARQGLVLALGEARVGGDRVHEHGGEQLVVGRVLRCAGNRCSAQHLVREADCPLVGLLGAHRPADDELQLLDTEPLTQQPLLGDDVVADAHPRKARHRDRRVLPDGVVRRHRQPAADLVDRDDEVPRRVQGVPLAHVDVAPGLVRAGVPRGDEDGVVLRRRQLAPCGVGQPAVRNRPALLELESADACHVVLAVELGAVERVLDHRVSSGAVWGTATTVSGVLGDGLSESGTPVALDRCSTM